MKLARDGNGVGCAVVERGERFGHANKLCMLNCAQSFERGVTRRLGEQAEGVVDVLSWTECPFEPKSRGCGAVAF